MHSLEKFYNDLSPHYHLIFEDWDNSINEQGHILSSLLPSAASSGTVLDCSCGIGTQLIALKQKGYDVEGSDISSDEVMRVAREAAKRNLIINIRVDDMRTLSTAPLDYYGVILSIGNSVPHLLTDQEIITAFISMKARLKPNGILLVGVKDYEHLMHTQTKSTEPLFFQNDHEKRIIHQIWDWHDRRIHTVHLYITKQVDKRWSVNHSTVIYRAISVQEIKCFMNEVGFRNVSILYPKTTGFYQPIIKGHK